MVKNWTIAHLFTDDEANRIQISTIFSLLNITSPFPVYLGNHITISKRRF